MIHTLSEKSITDVARRLNSLEALSKPSIREYRTSFTPETPPRLCRTVSNGQNYPSGTFVPLNAPPNNTFWIEFGTISYDDTSIGNKILTWQSYDPAEFMIARTLCGGWVHQWAYVKAVYYQNLWWLTELPQFYYGSSVGNITGGSVNAPGSGVVSIKVKDNTGALVNVELAVKNIGSQVPGTRPCYVWRSDDSFMVSEIC